MKKPSACRSMARLIVGASTTLCSVSLYLVALATAAQAQTSQVASQNESALAQPLPQSVATWQPLEARSFEISEDVSLEAVSASINTRLSGEDTVATKSSGIDLESLPIIGAFLDEEGNFEMDLPFTVDFGDLMGESVIIVGTDFSVD